MSDNSNIGVESFLPSDFLDLLRGFSYYSEGTQLWKILWGLVEGGSREFFVEWTDHGSDHIKGVFENAHRLITPEARAQLTSTDIFCLVTSILLHDLAMLYDHAMVHFILTSTQSEFSTIQKQWKSFIREAQHWDASDIILKYGEGNEVPRGADIAKYVPKNRFVVGEFLRRHHGALAVTLVDSDFALFASGASTGFVQTYKAFKPSFKVLVRMSAVIAESHTGPLRPAVDKFRDEFGPDDNSRQSVLADVHYAYLMAVLRLADFLEFRNSTSQYFINEVVRFKSPISKLENRTMDAHVSTRFQPSGMELVHLDYNAEDPLIHFHFQSYERAIQRELDSSWAVLSEQYSGEKDPSLSYKGLTTRRISVHNLSTKQLSSMFHSETLKITVSDLSVIFLLAGPLYNNDPRFALREIISNAHDAISEQKSMHPSSRGRSHIDVHLNHSAGTISFRDPGIGMTISEVSEFFLRVGGRLRETLEWKVQHDGNSPPERAYSYTSRFGVGVVSLFMIGDEIQVLTKRDDSPAVMLNIKPNLRELIAQKKADCDTGTILVVKGRLSVLKQLKELWNLNYPPTESGTDYGHIAAFMIYYFKFLPISHDIHFTRTTSDGKEVFLLNSVTSQLEDFASEWSRPAKSKHFEGRVVILTVGESKPGRILLELVAGKFLLVYNGLPVVMNYDRKSKSAENVIVVVDDASNKLDFNLQKTEFSDINENYLDAAFAAYYESVLERLSQDGRERQLIKGNPKVPWLKWEGSLEPFVFEPRLLAGKHCDGLFPLVFTFEGKFHPLTYMGIVKCESEMFLMIGVTSQDPFDLIEAAPGCIPTIIFSSTGEKSEVSPIKVAVSLRVNVESLSLAPTTREGQLNSLFSLFKQPDEASIPEARKAAIADFVTYLRMSGEFADIALFAVQAHVLKRSIGHARSAIGNFQWTKKITTTVKDSP